MTGKHATYACCAVLGLLMLAACNNKKELAGPPIMNGQWASADGVYTAQFLNGSFRAVANDTGNVISEGEYIALAADRIKLNWRGVVSATTNQAECTKPDPNQLDCVDLNGNRFSLRRNG